MRVFRRSTSLLPKNSREPGTRAAKTCVVCTTRTRVTHPQILTACYNVEMTEHPRVLFRLRSQPNHLGIAPVNESSMTSSPLPPWLQLQLKRVADHEHCTSTLQLGGPTTRIWPAGAVALGQLLPMTVKLKILVLTRSQVGPEGAVALGEGLSHNTSITTVFLEGNHFGDVGAEAMANVFKTNRTIQEIYLGSNNIHASGGIALARALEENSTLQLLQLESNAIGDIGASGFGNTLKRNRNLVELNLSRNKIEALGIERLSVGLEGNDTLKRFNLSENSIGHEGIGSLGRALRRNHGLRVMDLWGIKNIDDETKKRFVDSIQANFGLERIHFFGKTDQELKDDIQSALKFNKAGRKLLRADNVPSALWTRLLAKNRHDPDLLFYFLRAKPDLFLHRQPPKKSVLRVTNQKGDITRGHCFKRY